MANTIVECTSLIGGAANSVDSILHGTLANNDIVFATESNVLYVYRYNSTSTAIESSPDVIWPNDAGANTGRHILQNVYASNLDHDALTNFLATEHKTSTVIRAEVATPLYVETRTADPTTPVVGQIWLRTNL